MSDKGGLQLLAGTKRLEENIPGANRPVYFGVGILALTLAIYFGASLYANGISKKISDSNNQLAQIEQTRDTDNEQKLILFSKQSREVVGVLKNHIIWSRALEKLQRLISPKVQITNIAGQASKDQITVGAKTQNYVNTARQINAFLNADGIKDTVLSDIKSEPKGGITFGINLTIDPAKFLRLD